MKETDFLLPNIIDDDIEFLPLLSEDDEQAINKQKFPDKLPILPLRNTVLFPGVIIPITVGRDRSIKLIKEAYKGEKVVGVVAQRDTQVEDPSPKDLYKVGTVARIVRMLKMPDGNVTVIIQGRKSFKIKEILKTEPYIQASIALLKDKIPSNDKKFLAQISTVKDLAQKIIQLSPNIPTEAATALKNIDSYTFLLNFIASNLNIEVVDKQKILEITEFKLKADTLLKYLNDELQILEIKKEIQTKVHTDIEDQQREFLLNQQLKKIQEELDGGGTDHEIKRLQERALKKKWNKTVSDTFKKELNKLQKMNSSMPDYSVTLNYLELLLDLPWGEYTKDNFDLKQAEKVLDKDHYNMEKAKTRILEYLAVLKLRSDMKSPILCFVGPPGVGKTSLGKSIGKAINRKFIRMSLGGLHDEAEIRGHRKTYIGAMPGRIVQSLKKVNSSNPVFVLDEIDKVGVDFRGDPASALLEVLDPEQNNSFYDNFLELEYDLSKVMFVATANTLSTVHPALQDRMEIIYLEGYTVEEKIKIAQKHVIPRLRKDHGLSAKDIKFNPGVIQKLIEDHTRESGVRGLEKQLAAVMRYTAKLLALKKKYNIALTKDDVDKILGPAKFEKEIYKDIKVPGVAVGLAWTSTGGDILFIEVSLSRGKGKLTLTGNLGDVMKESANTALSFIKAHSEELGIPTAVFSHWDIHVHVPEGAIPKDGPSAGVTMLTALTSAFTQRKVKPYWAMTGEITLRGKVLAVGGVKEKILAAKRAGIRTVLLCKTNEKNVGEINKEHLGDISMHYVSNMLEVLDATLETEKVPNAKNLLVKEDTISKQIPSIAVKGK